MFSDPSSMYVVAGLSDLTNLANSQMSEVSSIVTVSVTRPRLLATFSLQQ